jgi:hypothetical protein
MHELTPAPATVYVQWVEALNLSSSACLWLQLVELELVVSGVQYFTTGNGDPSHSLH